MEASSTNNNQDDNKTPSSSSSSNHITDTSLLEAYRYINNVPGKNVRGTLIDCFQLWLKVKNDDDDSSSSSDGILETIKDIIGQLHNASLLIDDIEDNSKLRRGVPVAHSIFGIPTTINTANYVYFLALEKCQSLNSPKAMNVFVSELLNLHKGQGHDILWRDHHLSPGSSTGKECPSEDEYCQMVIDKTGGLFRLAVGLMQSFASQNKETNYTPLVNNLAMYFQIRDDYINLADLEYMKSKSFCEDLTEGKFSFPIIHCISQSTLKGDTRLISILKQRTSDIDVKRYAQKLMTDEYKSLQYTRNKCSSLKNEIEQQILEFGGNEPLLKLVQYLDLQLDKQQQNDK